MAVTNVEERLTVVEHQMAENAQRTDGLREAIRDFGGRMDRGFEAVEKRFEAMEQRFDRRFEAVEQRFEALEQRFDRRLESMEQRFDRRFVWLIGAVVATMATMVGILTTALFGS